MMVELCFNVSASTSSCRIQVALGSTEPSLWLSRLGLRSSSWLALCSHWETLKLSLGKWLCWIFQCWNQLFETWTRCKMSCPMTEFSCCIFSSKWHWLHWQLLLSTARQNKFKLIWMDYKIHLSSGHSLARPPETELPLISLDLKGTNDSHDQIQNG